MTAVPGLAHHSAMPEGAWDDLSEVPSRHPWRALRERFVAAVREIYPRTSDAQYLQEQLLFAAGRFDEGARLVRDLRPHLAGDAVRVLDVGSGNGGISFAFANDARNVVHALERTANPHALACRRVLDVPVRQVTGDGAALPFADGALDLVLLVDVLEHLDAPRAVAAEIMRVLRPGGLCVVLTPARLAYFLRRDPHYGVPGLVMLPNEVQRLVVDRVLRRHVVTATGDEPYNVTHTYWHAREIARLFPGEKTVEVLYGRDFRPPGGRFTWRWLRHPSWLVEHFRYELRWWFFGHLLIYKGAPDPGVPRCDRLT